MSITLHEGAEKSLNEVVVIGYGAVKKSDLTGSVTLSSPMARTKVWW
jgi:iron complex outermembrane receptor protein